jgi:hypothetical protein
MPTIWGEIAGLENALENIEFLLSKTDLPTLRQEKKRIEKRLNQLLEKAYAEEKYVDKIFKDE